MKIIHLSDLHFGTHMAATYENLKDTINIIEPDMVVISGDFTQNAYHSEFKLAQEFIKSLLVPVMCVPGNHDITGRNLWERFLTPYKRYKNYINHNISSVFENENIIIVGLNSARRAVMHWNWANGALSAKQRHFVNEMVKRKQDKWIIVTFHHPIHEVAHLPIHVTVFGGRQMMSSLHENHVDLVLTGHVHNASIDSIGDDVHKTVYLSASTALSERRRTQNNGFNLITLNDKEMSISVYLLDHNIFVVKENYIKARY